MSILQEYQTIRSGLKPGEFEAMEMYLSIHPDLTLSDLYYNRKVYQGFEAWNKKQEGLK
jgi:hypothetical protein